MKQDRKFPLPVLLFIIFFIFLSADTALCDKSGVSIVAPYSAKTGETITIELKVTHDGNNFIHYTDWVYVMINGKEIKRWEFGSFDKPEDEQFTRSITYEVAGPIEITAQANCNIHGGKGIVTQTVQIQ